MDLHRRQITFEVGDEVTGEVWRGRIWDPDRARLRRWLAEDLAPRAAGAPVAVAVEGCTGWRYVVEELVAAGVEAHVAEPAQTQFLRGNKRRAKTDRSDARLLRELLGKGELPESWIPPTVILEWRERIVLYKELLDQRTGWTQRIHAELFHHGVALPEGRIRSDETRSWLLGPQPPQGLSPAARQRIAIAYRMLHATHELLVELQSQLVAFGKRQPGCRALVEAHFGVGGLVAVAVWTHLGDCRRFARSDQVVRHAGLDVTVHSSDRSRSAGRLSRQGPPVLRWALFEAGKCAARRTSPDYQHYQAVKARQGGTRATLSIARTIARRCYHTLKALEPDVVYTDVA